jgi:fibronectin type 3 domain-containing protein
LSEAPLNEAAYTDAAALVGEHWCYVVRTVASVAPLVESESSSEVCVTRADTFAPAAPLGLAALLREGQVELSWSASPEPDLAHYRLYRSEAGQEAVRLAELPATETRFNDPSPVPGGSYRVTAVDASGNESPPSKRAEAVEP